MKCCAAVVIQNNVIVKDILVENEERGQEKSLGNV